MRLVQHLLDSDLVNEKVGESLVLIPLKQSCTCAGPSISFEMLRGPRGHCVSSSAVEKPGDLFSFYSKFLPTVMRSWRPP